MAHYYDSKPQGVVKKQTIKIKVKNISFDLTTSSGLFSLKHLDPASKLLIESAVVPKGSKVLDLGCGYGAIGLAIKKLQPSCQVILTDVNPRATRMTQLNAKDLKLDVDVQKSSILQDIADDDFDVILTNPPYVAGREICQGFIEESHEHLKDGGSLFLVARHTKGGKFLSTFMQETFGNVEDFARQGGFRVYHSVKN